MDIPWTDNDRSTLTQEDFININVSGAIYETLRTTLHRFPNTLLGSEVKRLSYFVDAKNAYFFDRCKTSFDAILYYYQSGGVITRPPSIPFDVFEKEIHFFDLGESVLLQLRTEEGYLTDDIATDQNNSTHGQKTFQSKVWETLEYPDSSSRARIVSIGSIFVIGLSILIFCIETLPVFKEKGKWKDKPQHWFSAIEMGCVVWFTGEYLLRLLSSPSKYRFLTSYLNLIDLLAILPYFLGLGINSGGMSTNATPICVLKYVRLVRVFRIFKLSRHSMSLKILGNTLKASVNELGMLFFSLFLGAVVFSSLLFYAEQYGNKKINSILDAFWFSLVSMTTVGYGDIIPVTSLGKLIGSMCAITGVLTFALSVPVIVTNFEFYYKKDRSKK